MTYYITKITTRIIEADSVKDAKILARAADILDTPANASETIIEIDSTGDTRRYENYKNVLTNKEN